MAQIITQGRPRGLGRGGRAEGPPHGRGARRPPRVRRAQAGARAHGRPRGADDPVEGARPHEARGHRARLAQAEPLKPPEAAQAPPLPAQGQGGPVPQPGPVAGHHLRAARGAPHAPGRDHRLAQPPRRGPEALGRHARVRGRGVRQARLRQARDPGRAQLGPGGRLRVGGVRVAARRPRDAAGHGRRGEVGRQRGDRALVPHAQGRAAEERGVLDAEAARAGGGGLRGVP